jgi:hypothetical protein
MELMLGSRVMCKHVLTLGASSVDGERARKRQVSEERKSETDM